MFRKITNELVQTQSPMRGSVHIGTESWARGHAGVLFLSGTFFASVFHHHCLPCVCDGKGGRQIELIREVRSVVYP